MSSQPKFFVTYWNTVNAIALDGSQKPSLSASVAAVTPERMRPSVVKTGYEQSVIAESALLVHCSVPVAIEHASGVKPAGCAPDWKKTTVLDPAVGSV
jgi:hypothetical protein